MLNLTKNQIICKKQTKNIISNKDTIKTSKHFPSSLREWRNSIYLYNKSNINVIPTADIASKKLIKAYFTLFNKNLESKIRTKKLSMNLRSRSQNKIFVSNGEFKHTNNKVIINLYLFNRQINNYNIAIKNLKTKLLKKLGYSTKIFSRRLRFLEKANFLILEQKRFELIKQKKLFLIKILNNNIFSTKTSTYINLCIRNYFLKLFKKEYNKTLKYYIYRQLLHINKSKFTYFYLQYLKEQLYKLYNKQVEFTLINLRRFYLNNDILLESITKKIYRNRRNVLIYIKGLRDKVSVLKKRYSPHKYEINKEPEKKTLLSDNNYQLVNHIKKTLKYKDITGFKLKAKGRLTKRYTASRSISKMIQKGNLYNADSSLKGLSSVLLKGNLNSNMQYAKSASKSRIGSFGLKSWIGNN